MPVAITFVLPAVAGIREKRQPMSLFARPRDFETSVRDELPVLYRVARRMGCTPEESEDLVQTALIKAYQAWTRFDGRHLRSWLVRILRNERLMALRGAKPTASLDENEAAEVADEPFWNQLAWKLEADRLLEELDRLPDIYRDTVQLCDVEQMSYEEAAEAMDVPVGTVRSRLFRARALLRDRVGASYAASQEATT